MLTAVDALLCDDAQHAQQRTGVLDPVRTPAERIAGGRARRGSLAQVIDQPVIKPIKAKDVRTARGLSAHTRSQSLTHATPVALSAAEENCKRAETGGIQGAHGEEPSFASQLPADFALTVPTTARALQRVMFERIAAQVKASREAKRKKAEKAYRESLRSIRQGNKFVEDVQHNLETHAAAAMLKQRSRHAEWEEKVFDPVAKSINDAINTRSTKQIARLRQHEYDKFLEATRSRDLFTDIVTEEYDPFTLNRVAPRAKKPTVFDPSSVRHARARVVYRPLAACLTARVRPPRHSACWPAQRRRRRSTPSSRG